MIIYGIVSIYDIIYFILVLTQEQSEMLTTLPFVPPYSRVHYTPPVLNVSFPNTPSSEPMLHFTAQPQVISTIDPDNSTYERVVQWSTGIQIYSLYDTFVSIPFFGDVRIHIEHVGHTRHMYLDPVGRAEVSALEIRSRIRGGKQIKTTVVQMTNSEDNTSNTIHVYPNSPDFIVQSPISDGVAQLIDRWKTLPPRISVEAGLVCRNLRIIIEDCLSNPAIIQEALSLCVDTLVVSYHPVGLVDTLVTRRQHELSSLNFAIAGLQVDNQLYESSNYDFPVVLLSTFQQQTDVLFPATLNKKTVLLCPVAELVKTCMGESDAMIFLSFGLCYDVYSDSTILQTVHVTISPLSLNIEDSFAYYVLNIADSFVLTRLNVAASECMHATHYLPSDVDVLSSSICQPVRLQKITVSHLNVLLSVHASLKLFISSDRSPLSFVAFTRSNMITSHAQLTRTIIMHYASGALFRAGKLYLNGVQCLCYCNNYHKY